MTSKSHFTTLDEKSNLSQCTPTKQPTSSSSCDFPSFRISQPALQSSLMSSRLYLFFLTSRRADFHTYSRMLSIQAPLNNSQQLAYQRTENNCHTRDTFCSFDHHHVDYLFRPSWVHNLVNGLCWVCGLFMLTFNSKPLKQTTSPSSTPPAASATPLSSLFLLPFINFFTCGSDVL